MFEMESWFEDWNILAQFTAKHCKLIKEKQSSHGAIAVINRLIRCQLKGAFKQQAATSTISKVTLSEMDFYLEKADIAQHLIMTPSISAVGELMQQLITNWTLLAGWRMSSSAENIERRR